MRLFSVKHADQIGVQIISDLIHLFVGPLLEALAGLEAQFAFFLQFDKKR